MPNKVRRSPPEKKALSYARDRRNVYGENDKASRKAVPRRKAMTHRKDRRATALAVASLALLDEAQADIVESSARQDIRRVGGWRKSPDAPLGEVVARAKEARVRRAGAKAARATRRATSEDPLSLRWEARQLRRTARMLLLHARSHHRRETLRDTAKEMLLAASDCERRAEAIAQARR